MNGNWKRDLSEVINERMTRDGQQHDNQANLINLFVRIINPFLAEFTNQVRRNQYVADVETSQDHAKLTVGDDHNNQLYVVSFSGEATSDGIKVAASEPGQTDFVVFDGVYTSLFDSDALADHLISRIRNAVGTLRSVEQVDEDDDARWKRTGGFNPHY